MKSLITALSFAALGLVIGTSALAQERGTLDDAVAMVKKAKAYMVQNGKEKALTEFSNPKGEFINKDIYIFAFDKNGKNLAHGAIPKMIGKDMIDIKDTDGVYYIKELLKVGQAGGGKVNFKFLNPVTKAVEQKTAYAEMVNDVLIGSGAYNK